MGIAPGTAGRPTGFVERSRTLRCLPGATDSTVLLPTIGCSVSGRSSGTDSL